MSATDELRRLLDERGVEYETYIEQPTGFEHVKWNFSEHGSADFNLEFGEPWLTMYGVISGPEQAIAATLGAGTCREVYLLMATDIGDGCEEVLGIYATEEAATEAINENKFGYALHHVRKLEVTS